MKVRDAQPQDDASIRTVVREAFGGEDEADLVRRLGEGGDSVVSLVAEKEGEIVGHVLLSRMTAPFRALALAPVSVIPSRQRSGVGSAMVREATRRTTAASALTWRRLRALSRPTSVRIS